MNTGSLFLRERRSHGRIERRWVASLRIGDKRPTAACSHQHGRAERHPCEEAQRNLDELRRIAAGLAPLDLRTATVGSFLLRWIGRLDGLAPATLRQHEMIVRVHLAPYFRSKPLTALRPSDVDEYLSWKVSDTSERHRGRCSGYDTTKKPTPQTVRHHRATLRRALQDAVRDGYIATNPAALSRPPRMVRTERRYLTAAEARRLIDTTRDERYWPLWTLLVTTGLRLGEALGLTWSDVEGLNDGHDRATSPAELPVGGAAGTVGDGGLRRGHGAAPTLTVRHQLIRVPDKPGKYKWLRTPPKTPKSRRTVSLIPDAIEALREQRRRQDKDLGDRPRPIEALVFTTVTGLPVHGTNVIPPFRRALRAAGLPEMSLHGLRHGYASILLAAGVPIPAIAKALGHSSPRLVMELYGHVVPDMERDATDRLTKALA